ncbi:hypothetical protein E8E14_004107 [Neopestalotiopsis sp. 37M]|nr:hypothetical protein E8E14_004107 [Neopestalotiopsis sp. 37M]
MASLAPQIVAQLGVQFFPSTGSCSIDIAAAINLGRCGYIDIGVEEQHHVNVLPDKICVTPTQPESLAASSSPPLPPVRTSPPVLQVSVGGSGNGNGNGNHNSGSNNGNNNGIHDNNNVVGYSKNNFGIINNGGRGNHEHDNVNNNKNDNNDDGDNVHHDGGDGSSSSSRSSSSGSSSYTTPSAVTTQPDYCQRPTYEIDITSIPDLSTSDIEAHLALLGLKVDVHVDLDLDLSLGIEGGGGGVLGRRGLLGGRPGSRSSSDDARAVRQALHHIYNVRCGRSLHAHPGAVGCRAVDLASCLNACSAAAVRSGRALECVGATYMRRSSSSASSTSTNSNSNSHHGGNKAVTTTIATTTEETSTTTNCWFVLGETHDILDVNVSAELETYDSLFIAA